MLASIDIDLIVRLWPPERISEGIAVSRDLRRELVRAPHVVLKARRKITPKMVAGISRFLQQFHGSVEVCGMEKACATNGSKLLRAIIMALKNGWRGLHSLDFSGIGVNDNDCFGFADSINELRQQSACHMPCIAAPHIEHLRLSNNQIGVDGVCSMGMSPVFQNLSSLDLSFNSIGPGGASYLASSLRQCRGLRSLDLTCCGLGPTGLEKIGPALTECSSIEELFFACNNIGDAGIASLAAISGEVSFPASLRVLDISAKAELRTPAGQVVMHQSALPNASDYENGGTITELGACLLAQGLLQCSKLRVLRIGDHNLGRGASRIMASLAHNGNIEELDMKSCNIHYCPEFFKHLASFRKLESLDISSNQFEGANNYGWDDRVADIEDFCNTRDTSDVVSFFKILPSLHTLRRVNLSNINMSDEAISVLKSVLSSCPDQMNIRMESCGLSVFNTLCSKTTSWCGTMPQSSLDLVCGTLPREVWS